MSLNFDLGNIRDWQELCQPGGGPRALLEGLIMITMIVGMGEITLKNHEDFYRRLSMYERTFGQFIPGGYTLEQVRRAIGLKTNVATLTERQFMARITQRLKEDSMTDLRKAKEALDLAKVN